MDIELQQGEEIIKKGAANHFVKIESVGGQLFLTNERVVFKSHSINIQTHELSIPFNQIEDIGKRNTLLIVPNGIFIKLITGKIEKFVVWKRNEWISKIKEFLKK